MVPVNVFTSPSASVAGTDSVCSVAGASASCVWDYATTGAAASAAGSALEPHPAANDNVNKPVNNNAYFFFIVIDISFNLNSICSVFLILVLWNRDYYITYF